MTDPPPSTSITTSRKSSCQFGSPNETPPPISLCEGTRALSAQRGTKYCLSQTIFKRQMFFSLSPAASCFSTGFLLLIHRHGIFSFLSSRPTAGGPPHSSWVGAPTRYKRQLLLVRRFRLRRSAYNTVRPRASLIAPSLSPHCTCRQR